jgi:hypothetical protein
LNGISALSVRGNSHIYTFTFTQPSDGTITTSWDPAHGITDTAAALTRIVHKTAEK